MNSSKLLSRILLSVLWLLSGPWSVKGQEVATAEGGQTSFRVTDYMMTGLYRMPDHDVFELPHWWNGLSISTFWHPAMRDIEYPGEWNLPGVGLSVTKDFTSANALRLGYIYQSGRHELQLDHLWNLSNYYNGYNAGRRFEWLATIGMSAGYDPDYDIAMGGQFGFQMRHTLSPYVSFYLEPQYHAIVTHTPGLTRIYDGVALQVGLISRLTSPWRRGGYGHQVHQAFNWLYGVGVNLICPERIRMNRNHGMQRWYVELLGGTQLFNDRVPITEIVPYPSGFDLVVGKHINTVYGLQGSVFQQSLNLFNAEDRDEVFGIRLELNADLLRALWANATSQGWAWIVSGGGEIGRQQTWDHASQRYYMHYGPTVATQLRYRLTDGLWLSAQARVQQIRQDEDLLQHSAMLGVHYEMNHDRAQGRKFIHWLDGVYLSAAEGWWNSRSNAVDLAIGFGLSPVHGIRLEYDYSETQTISTAIRPEIWHSFGVDYVYNVSNAVLGYDPARRFSLQTSFGYNVALHNLSQGGDLLHCSSYVGMQTGVQLEFRLANYLAAFAEARTIYQPFNLYFNPNSRQAWNMIGIAGLKLYL